MNNKLHDLLQTHLKTTVNHVVKVNSKGLKLIKSASKRKYVFSLEDIEQKYNSIANFLEILPQKGFASSVEFTLQKIYTKNGKTTYHTIQKITEDLQTQDMSATQQPFTPPQTITANNFLGAPELMAKMVQAERSADYKEQVGELKETVKDLRSRNRVLEEKNSSLTIKLETAKERSELRVERELLNKKSFLETPAFEKTMETLGSMIPKALEVANAKNMANASQLGNPNISPIKKAFFDKVNTANIEDEKIMFFNYLLDNWDKTLIQQVAQIIEKKEDNYEDTQ